MDLDWICSNSLLRIRLIWVNDIESELRLDFAITFRVMFRVGFYGDG